MQSLTRWYSSHSDIRSPYDGLWIPRRKYVDRLTRSWGRASARASRAGLMVDIASSSRLCTGLPEALGFTVRGAARTQLLPVHARAPLSSGTRTHPWYDNLAIRDIQRRRRRAFRVTSQATPSSGPRSTPAPCLDGTRDSR